MKKNILFAFLLSFMFVGQMVAQISLETDTLSTMVADGSTDVVNHNTVINSAADGATFRWVRNEVSIPDEWDSAVCDPYQCYFHTVDSISFDLGANASGVMDVHVYPNGVWTGSATIEVTVKEVGNESNAVTGVYIFEGTPTGTHEAQLIQFKVFPNPTNGLFAIEGETEDVTSMTIYSTLGQQLVHLNIQDGDWYNVSNLPAGTYVVQLSAEDGRTLGSKMINKY